MTIIKDTVNMNLFDTGQNMTTKPSPTPTPKLFNDLSYAGDGHVMSQDVVERPTRKRPFKEQPKQVIKSICKKARYNETKFLKILQDNPKIIRQYLFNHQQYEKRKKSAAKPGCSCEHPRLRMVQFKPKKLSGCGTTTWTTSGSISYVVCNNCHKTYRMTSVEACMRALQLNPELYRAVPKKYRCQELELIAKCG